MSWSWIFLGHFTILPAVVAAVEAAVPPRLTSLEVIRNTAELADAVYEGTRLHLRRVFEKSLHDDVVEELEQQFSVLLKHGVTGEGYIVGFSLDGGPDDVGTLFVLRGGALERREMKPSELEAAAHADAHEATVERFEAAYADT